MPIGEALAAVTLLSSVSGAAVGLLMVYTFALKPEVIADTLKLRDAVLTGHYEALGNIFFGLTLALVQIVALCLAWCKGLLADDKKISCFKGLNKGCACSGPAPLNSPQKSPAAPDLRCRSRNKELKERGVLRYAAAREATQ